METNQQPQLAGKDSQISVVLTQDLHEGSSVDIVRVFHNMKVRKRFFAWVLVFCMLLGIAAALLAYQLGKPMLKVSSVVVFDYDILNAAGKKVGHVSDLTAPDGQPLDLDQMTSAYVLQKAIDMSDLSRPITAVSLRRNIRIERILTEESKRQMEVAEKMVKDKNNAAYSTVSDLELKYENKVTVTLTNGFTTGDEDSNRIVLEDNELPRLLNNILLVYNDYLVLTYANQMMPDDEFAVIDTDRMDVLESLDLIRTAVQNLRDYCNSQPDRVKRYRSSVTGFSLQDLTDTLMTVRSVNVDYLYSYVYTNSLSRDSATILTSYEFQLRNAESRRDQINESIATTQTILDTYKNDEIYVSMQDSDTSRSTRTTTDYYNELVLQQADNYAKLATVETRITDLKNKVDNLKLNQSSGVLDDINAELNGTLECCKDIYAMICNQMTEIFDSRDNNTYAQYSSAYGKTQNFLTANARNMILGAAAGAVVACALWFMSGLIKEMKRGKKFDDDEEEAGV